MLNNFSLNLDFMNTNCLNSLVFYLLNFYFLFSGYKNKYGDEWDK